MKVHETPVSGQAISKQQEGANHVARIEGVLSRVYTSHGFQGVTNRTPLSELLKKEETNPEETGDADSVDSFEARELRLVLFRRLLRYVFGEDPHPGKVMRRVYAVARAYDPDLIMGMNGSDLAIIFDETRSATSARVQLMFTGYLKKAGAKGNHVPFQKKAGSTAKYAASARGNQNRKGKKAARMARTAKDSPIAGR